jgi:hypothetical protein
MTEDERKAIRENLGLQEKAGRRRDFLLFAAGVAAGVVTNPVVKSRRFIDSRQPQRRPRCWR